MMRHLGFFLLACWATGCGSTVDQTIKNEAYSLSSRWHRISDQLDQLQRQTLVAERLIEENAGALGNARLADDDPDTWRRLQALKQQYLAHTKAFLDLRKRVEALQADYSAAHEAYNAFQTLLDNNDLSDDAAQQQLAQHKRKRKRLQDELDLLAPAVEEAVKRHDRLVISLQQVGISAGLRELKNA